MKYVKANDLLPEELLKEIQKYVQGELVYIPNCIIYNWNIIPSLFSMGTVRRQEHTRLIAA